MKEIISTITSKGQVTIPVEVRRHLGVDSHDKLSFVIEDDGTVRVSTPRYPDINSVVGAAGSLNQPRTWHEMIEIATEERLETKYRRGGE